jgi:hypothetical protein
VIVDPFDAALSDFIDSLPESWQDAQALLDQSQPFRGLGDLPELAEFATSLRAIEPPRPSAEWMAASKARIMAAPVPACPRRGFLTQLRGLLPPLAGLKPSLPFAAMPSLTSPSLFGRAAVALAVIVSVGSIAYSEHAITPAAPPPDQPAADAQQAITLAEREVDLLPRESAAPESQVAGVYIKGTPKDVVLLSKYFSDAELAIAKAPPEQQPRLQAKLDSVVNAVRFDGSVDAVNGNTVSVSGVPVALDPGSAAQLQVGQTVSIVVSVDHGGQLHAVQVAATSPAPRQSNAPPRSPSPPGGPTSGPDQRASAGNIDGGGAGSEAGASSVSVPPSPSPSASAATSPGTGHDAAAQPGDANAKDDGGKPGRDADGALSQPATGARNGAISGRGNAGATAPTGGGQKQSAVLSAVSQAVNNGVAANDAAGSHPAKDDGNAHGAGDAPAPGAASTAAKAARNVVDLALSSAVAGAGGNAAASGAGSSGATPASNPSGSAPASNAGNGAGAGSAAAAAASGNAAAAAEAASKTAKAAVDSANAAVAAAISNANHVTANSQVQVKSNDNSSSGSSPANGNGHGNGGGDSKPAQPQVEAPHALPAFPAPPRQGISAPTRPGSHDSSNGKGSDKKD